MQTQTCETQPELNLERAYKRLNQRLGHPARDMEICNEMKITLEEFYQMLDRMTGLDIGCFRALKSQNQNACNDPLIGYVPKASETDAYHIFRKSVIRELLTKAIEELPQMERLATSLFYYDELTPKEIAAVLRIEESGVSHLLTKATLRLRSKIIE
jgi:RNA polymerase sigma factor FliA